MERYTFEQIKSFQLGDVFWARNQEFEVNSQPIYFSESEFYGAVSEKIEWLAIAADTRRQSKFQVANVRGKENATDPIIFKTPTSEPAIGIINYNKVNT